MKPESEHSTLVARCLSCSYGGAVQCYLAPDSTIANITSRILKLGGSILKCGRPINAKKARILSIRITHFSHDCSSSYIKQIAIANSGYIL